MNLNGLLRSHCEELAYSPDRLILELHAHPGDAFQCHVTAVGMGNLPHNGQAKPGPALAAPGRVRPI